MNLHIYLAEFNNSAAWMMGSGSDTNPIHARKMVGHFRQVILNYNDMDFWMTIEWDEQCGLLASKVFPLLDALKGEFAGKDYGKSVSRINVVMTCMAKDLKQRKRFKKVEGLFEYDILLDYFLIKHAIMEEKKIIICKQMVEITEYTFSKYKFEDFDKTGFLAGFKEIVNAVVW